MDQPISLLIVEDDDIARFMETKIVQDYKCEVDSVGNGTLALIKISEKRYDLVLMDIGLPDRDGLELTKKIRSSDGHNQHVPIIALTTHEDKAYQNMATNFGMNAYVVKPLTKEKFLDALKVCRLTLPTTT